MRKVYLLWLISTSVHALNLQDYINPTNCNLIIKQQNYQACYDYKLKSDVYFTYRLGTKDILKNKPTPKTQISYYPDLDIPQQFRSYPEDYSDTTYNLTTMINSHSNLMSSKYKLSMATVIPLTPQLTQKIWAELENYELALIKQYGNVNVLNILTYDNSPPKIGKHQIAVPSNIIKVIYNNQKQLMRCFSFHNESMVNPPSDLLDYQVSCNMLLN